MSLRVSSVHGLLQVFSGWDLAHKSVGRASLWGLHYATMLGAAAQEDGVPDVSVRGLRLEGELKGSDMPWN